MTEPLDLAAIEAELNGYDHHGNDWLEATTRSLVAEVKRLRDSYDEVCMELAEWKRLPYADRVERMAESAAVHREREAIIKTLQDAWTMVESSPGMAQHPERATLKAIKSIIECLVLDIQERGKS